MLLELVFSSFVPFYLFLFFPATLYSVYCIINVCFCFRVSNDSNFVKYVAGVLVESGAQNKLKGKRYSSLIIITCLTMLSD